jgi:hypothetical protein
LSAESPSRLKLSQRLSEFAAQLPEGGLSVGQLVHQLGREGLLLLCVLLSLPFLLPVSIPGVSTVFGLLILFIGIAEMMQAPIWLPGKVARFTLTRERLQDILKLGANWVQRLERLTSVRGLWLTQGRIRRFNGAMLVAGAVMLMMPLAIIPFSNTLPALACIFLAVGMLGRDGRCILIGCLFNLLSALYFGLIAWLGTAVVLNYLGPYLPTWVTGWMG